MQAAVSQRLNYERYGDSLSDGGSNTQPSD